MRTAEEELTRSEQRVAAAQQELDRAERRAAAAEQGLADREQRLAALLAELTHLAEERLPAEALALNHPNAPVPGLKDPQFADQEAADALRAVLDGAAAAVLGERARVDAAARATMRGAASKIQTLLYQIQSLVQQMQEDNDDPRLLEVDFRNELALRRIQTVAVLCEAWPGLARTDSPLSEVVLGAVSRVPGYGRVKVANHLREPRLAVVARAAEPLAIAIAELLANATAYSHPETEVPVTIQQGGRSALVVIDDAGIGMDEDELRRARRLLAGPPEVLLTELGNPPRAGFAVIGRLARQYGFACHIEPSPYGGMRTIVRVGGALLGVVDAEQPLSVLAPQPVRVTPSVPSSPSALAVASPAPTGHTARPAALPDPDTLPSRRRREPLAPAPERAPEDRRPAVERTPEQAAARWEALQRGTGSGRAAAQGDHTPDPTSEGADQ